MKRWSPRRSDQGAVIGWWVRSLRTEGKVRKLRVSVARMQMPNGRDGWSLQMQCRKRTGPFPPSFHHDRKLLRRIWPSSAPWSAMAVRLYQIDM